MNKNGISRLTAQKAEILPKLLCQKTGLTNGKMAIDSSMHINGTAQIKDKSAPFKCATAPSSEPAAKPIFTMNKDKKGANMQVKNTLPIPFALECRGILSQRKDTVFLKLFLQNSLDIFNGFIK